MKKETKKIDNSNKIIGTSFFSGSEQELLTELGVHLQKPSLKGLITLFTPNPEQLVMAKHDDTFSTTLSNSTYNLADGIGIIWAQGWLQRTAVEPYKKLHKITGVDLLEKLTLLTLEQGKKVCFLGGQSDMTSLAKTQLLSNPAFHRFDETSIVTSHGYDNIEHPTEAEAANIEKLLATEQPAVLFVGFGAPWQEQWIIEHKSLLEQSGVKIAMVVGGAFDIVAGKLPRAPFIWRKIGLEWLWRLILQPSRWRRQLRLIDFVAMVLRSR